VKRCFVFSLNEFDEIELYELTKDSHFDHDGTDNVRIEWEEESRAMNFGNAYEMKQLESSDLFWDSVDGDVSIQIQFRPDSYPCWIRGKPLRRAARLRIRALGELPYVGQFQADLLAQDAVTAAS
jgi:hypothetical protein